MKTVLTKSLVVVVGGALVVPFAAAAVLVGARAVAGAGGAKQLLLMAVLALVWTLFGGVKGFARMGEDERGTLIDEWRRAVARARGWARG